MEEQQTSEDTDVSDPAAGEGDESSTDGEDDDVFCADIGVPFLDSKEAEILPVYSGLVGDDDPPVGHLTLVLGKQGSGEHLDHSIHAVFRDGYHFDGSVRNQSIHNLGRGKTGNQFKGPHVLFGVGKVAESKECRDLSCSDITTALQGLLEYHMRANYGLQRPPKLSKKVKGVVVKGSGTVFEEVNLPLQHPIFTSGTSSGISMKVGKPLLTIHQGKRQAEDSINVEGHSSNPAAFLHVRLDTLQKLANGSSESQNGTIPPRWAESTQNVIVARQDSKPLDVEVVEAMCQFGKKEAQHLLGANPASFAEAKKLVDEITEKKWKRFLANRAKKQKGHDEGLASGLGNMSLGSKPEDKEND